jgi:glycosyltransferase involved in cell wall biosynthesis
LGVADKVDFLGYVTDIPRLLNGCDCAVSTSKYEGLPFNILEAMASGLPIVASRIAGHTDLLDEVSLFTGDLAEKLVAEYQRGKRRVVYENLPLYSIENVMPEWRELWKEVI